MCWSRLPRKHTSQAFIKSMTAHPVLRASEALKIFLLHPGDLARNPAWTLLVNPPASFKQQRAGQDTPPTHTHHPLPPRAQSSSLRKRGLRLQRKAAVHWTTASPPI